MTQQQTNVTTVPADPSTSEFRNMLDQYAEELTQYEPDEWVRFVREQARDDNGHLPWPSLGVGPAQDGVQAEPELQALEIRTSPPLPAVGFMIVRDWQQPFQFGEIRDMWIKPRWRRLGIGQAAVESYQRSHSSGVLIEVWRANRPAIFFWTTLGFERLGDSTRWGEEVGKLLAVHAWPRGRFSIGKP